MKYIERRRQNSKYYFGDGNDMFYHQTTGASYELSKRMCQITGAHIVTNLKFRWKEVEIDRISSGIDASAWSPFAKALQDSGLKTLSRCDHKLALRIREEKRLDSMRRFLRRVWKASSSDDAFSESVATDFASELEHEVAIANEEWKKIDRDLIKWFSAPSAAAIMAASTGMVPQGAIATGLVVNGAFDLINSSLKRAKFRDIYPAGFLID